MGEMIELWPKGGRAVFLAAMLEAQHGNLNRDAVRSFISSASHRAS